MKTRLGLFWWAIWISSLRVLAAGDPATNGVLPWAAFTASIPGVQGATLSTDVYYPGSNGSLAGSGSYPAVVLGHGFMQSKAYHVNQGRQMATRGFITLIPSFAGGSDHSRNADDLRACLDWITAQGAGPGSMFFGRVNTNRFGLTGHSAGGLSAILAASRDARVKAISLMDPVDNSGLGVAALPGLRIPVAMTWSEPSACNASGSAEVLYAAAGAVKRGIKIVGANHSDPQDPVAFLSTLTCGGANSARQALYRRYMVGWFEYYLREDTSSEPWVFRVSGGPLAADLAAGRITYSLTGDPLKLHITPGKGGAWLQPQGLPGQNYVLQASDRPGAPWIDLETNSVDAGATWVETVEPQRFFRTREFE